MRVEKTKKCKICKGRGYQSYNDLKYNCLYCRGKGTRNRSYGRDKIQI